MQANKGVKDGPNEWALDFAYIGYMHAESSGWAKLAFDLRVLKRSAGTVFQGKGLWSAHYRVGLRHGATEFAPGSGPPYVPRAPRRSHDPA